MSEISIREGKKIADEELKNLDRAAMRVAIAGPPKAAEVEGQFHYVPEPVRCPWCGNFLRAMGDPRHGTWFTCGFCGGALRV